MDFTREEILQVVICALKEAQEDFPDEVIEMEEETRPIGGLAYFDSLTSVSVTVRCLEALDYDDELSMPTVFINKEGKYLTVGEAADKIMKLLKMKK